MKKTSFPACLILLTLIIPATLHAQDFWLLNGAEPTSENRLNAIQNAGVALLDFAIYQPEKIDAFPEEYRQKLLDAGFVFDFITEQQLSETVHVLCTLHNSPVGLTRVLVIPNGATLPEEEFRRLDICYAFLGKAPELPEPADKKDKKTVTSLADRKEDAKRINYSYRSITRIDQIGDDLGEAMGLFMDCWFPIVPDSFAAETGVRIQARRGSITGRSVEPDYDDVFYVLANTKEDARPIDGWFRLRHLSPGRFLGTAMFGNGDDDWCEEYFAEDDRAFFMDPVTGKIGEASVRMGSDLRIRIQMKPGETLGIRIVRERCKNFENLGYGEFESLGTWEYESSESSFFPDEKDETDDDEIEIEDFLFS